MTSSRPPRVPTRDGFAPEQKGYVPSLGGNRGHVPSPSKVTGGHQPTKGEGGPSGPPPNTGSGVQPAKKGS